MTDNRNADVRTEEEHERVRHDELYREERTGEVRILEPDAWERFDRDPDSPHPYFWMVQQLGDLTGKRVLDYGCGTGWFSVILAKRGAARVDGFDISGEAIRDAEACAEANGVGDVCNFVRGSAYEIPWPDASYDVVAGMAIIHHLRNKEVAAAELARVLKPGGRAVFFEPLGNSMLFERFRQFLPIKSDTDDPDHWKDKVSLKQLEPFEKDFDLKWREFELTYSLGRYLKGLGTTFALLDRFLLDHVPGAKHFARGLVLIATRKSS